MLSFEEKLSIMESYPELQRKDVSLGRVNFHYDKSSHDKKTVVFHLHPNGNGFIYAGLLKGYSTDEKGFVNIHNFTAGEIRSLLSQSIASLSSKVTETPNKNAAQESRWIGPDHQSLLLKREDDLWYLYAGLDLEMAFETYDEAQRYLQEEGFTQL